MSSFRFQEGEIDPGVRLEDGSVNLLVARERGLCVFVSRLPSGGLGVDALVARRLNDLRRAMPGFALLEQEARELDGVPGLASCVAFREGGGRELVQRMIAVVVPIEGTTMLLTLGVTGPRASEREVGTLFRHVLASARMREGVGERAA